MSYIHVKKISSPSFNALLEFQGGKKNAPPPYPRHAITRRDVLQRPTPFINSSVSSRLIHNCFQYRELLSLDIYTEIISSSHPAGCLLFLSITIIMCLSSEHKIRLLNSELRENMVFQQNKTFSLTTILNSPNSLGLNKNSPNSSKLLCFQCLLCLR